MADPASSKLIVKLESHLKGTWFNFTELSQPVCEPIPGSLGVTLAIGVALAQSLSAGCGFRTFTIDSCFSNAMVATSVSACKKIDSMVLQRKIQAGGDQDMQAGRTCLLCSICTLAKLRTVDV